MRWSRLLSRTGCLALLAGGCWAADPAPSQQQQQEFLAAVRRKAAQYVTSLPDYICTEKITRYQNGKKADTLSVRLSHYQGREQYELMAIDGQSAEQPYDSISGLKSHGEFRGVLELILGLGSPTAFQFRQLASIRGRRAAIYAYELPLPGSDFELSWENRGEISRKRAGLSGEIAIDRETLDVLKLTYRARTDDFTVRRSSASIDYGEVEIGGRKYLLPSRANMTTEANSWLFVNYVNFTKYRKFSSESTVRFADESVEK